MRTVVIANRDRACRTSVLHLGMSWGAALVVLAVAAPAPAQQYKSDRDLLTHQTCTELSSEDCSRLGRLKEGEARHQANKQARRNKLLRLPPLPDERNVLLGSWRLEDAGRGGWRHWVRTEERGRWRRRHAPRAVDDRSVSMTLRHLATLI